MGLPRLAQGVARREDVQAEAAQQHQRGQQEALRHGRALRQQEKRHPARGEDGEAQPGHQIPAAQDGRQQAEPQDAPRAAPLDGGDGQRQRQQGETVKEAVVHRAVIPVKALHRVGAEQQPENAQQSRRDGAQLSRQVEDPAAQADAEGEEPAEERGAHEPWGQGVEPLGDRRGLQAHEKHRGVAALPGFVDEGGVPRRGGEHVPQAAAVRQRKVGGGAEDIVVCAGHVVAPQVEVGRQQQEKGGQHQQRQGREGDAPPRQRFPGRVGLIQ